jgi:uncharacterized protein (TIGR03435 family)
VIQGFLQISRLATWAVLGLVGAMTAIAQGPPSPAPASPQYDLVSTVKPNHSGESRLRIRMDEDAIYIENASVKDLLSNTYGVRGTLILGLPKWAEADHFDIRAKVLSDDPKYLQNMTRVQRRQIFERLLSERFGVETHKETRTLPVYELVQSGHGPQLVENPPPPPSAQPEAIKPGHNGRGNTSVMGTHLDATGVRIGDLCSNLAGILDRSVINKTGLTSFYDMTLNWSDERADPTDSVAQAAGPSLFTALQEQLGLKLVSAKGPVDVLVVDKASQPKED